MSIHERLRRLEVRRGLDRERRNCPECGLYPARIEFHTGRFGGKDKPEHSGQPCPTCDQLLAGRGEKRMTVHMIDPSTGRCVEECGEERDISDAAKLKTTAERRDEVE